MKQKTINAGKRIKKIFFMMLAQFEDPYYQGVAAQIAFSLFLSIIPILILISQLLGLFSLSLNEIRLWVDDNVTVEGADKLFSFLEYSPSGANSIFLAVLALYAASRVQFALMRVANYTLTDGKVIGQGFPARQAEIRQNDTYNHLHGSIFAGGAGLRRTDHKFGLWSCGRARNIGGRLGTAQMAYSIGNVFSDDIIQLLYFAYEEGTVPRYSAGKYFRGDRILGGDLRLYHIYQSFYKLRYPVRLLFQHCSIDALVLVLGMGDVSGNYFQQSMVGDALYKQDSNTGRSQS